MESKEDKLVHRIMRLLSLQFVFCFVAPLFLSVVVARVHADSSPSSWIRFVFSVNRQVFLVPEWWCVQLLIALALVGAAVGEGNRSLSQNETFCQTLAGALVAGLPFSAAVFVGLYWARGGSMGRDQGMVRLWCLLLPILFATGANVLLTPVLACRRKKRMRILHVIMLVPTIVLGVLALIPEDSPWRFPSVCAIGGAQGVYLLFLTPRGKGFEESHVVPGYFERIAMLWSKVDPSLIWITLLPWFYLLIILSPIPPYTAIVRENWLAEVDISFLGAVLAWPSKVSFGVGWYGLAAALLVTWAVLVPAVYRLQVRDSSWQVRTTSFLICLALLPFVLGNSIHSLFVVKGGWVEVSKYLSGLFTIYASLAFITVGATRFIVRRRAPTMKELMRAHLMTLLCAGISSALLMAGCFFHGQSLDVGMVFLACLVITGTLMPLAVTACLLLSKKLIHFHCPNIDGPDFHGHDPLRWAGTKWFRIIRTASLLWVCILLCAIAWDTLL